NVASNITLWGVWGYSATDVYAVGSAGTIAHYNGTSWTSTQVSSGALFAVSGTSSTNVFAVGLGGVIYRYNGVSWTSMSSPATTDLYGVSASSGTEAFAAGAGGTLLRYDGSGWANLTAPYGTDYLAVWAAGGGTAFFGADAGHTCVFRAPACTPLSLSQDNNAVAISGTSSAFVVGDFHTILSYNGTTFAAAANQSDPGYYSAVWAISPTSAFAAGNSGVGIQVFNGSTWTRLA